MAQTTAQADAILKNHYLPVLREQINQRALLLFGYSPDELDAGMGHANAQNGETMNYNGIIRDADKFEFAGRNWYFASHTKRNESGTATAEGGDIPLPGQQGFEDFFDGIKHFYKQFEITGFAMEVSERSVGAYVKLLEAETEGTMNDARHSLNREGYGDGTGTIATVVTDDGVRTATVDSIQYLRVGMVFDIIDVDTDVVDSSGGTIATINATTKQITWTGGSDPALDATKRFCLKGNWKKEINGLKNIIGPDGASYATLHNVNGSTAGNEYWKGQVLDGNAATFDEDQGQQMLDTIAADAGRETELIITSRGIRRRYVNTLKAQKRFNDGNSVVLHGGFKAVMFNESPMLHDDQAPKGNMWFLRTSDFGWVWLGANDFRWLQRDGKILRMTIGVGAAGEDRDNWRATLYRFHDLACFSRKGQGRIKNLADDAAVVSS